MNAIYVHYGELGKQRTGQKAKQVTWTTATQWEALLTLCGEFLSSALLICLESSFLKPPAAPCRSEHLLHVPKYGEGSEELIYTVDGMFHIFVLNQALNQTPCLFVMLKCTPRNLTLEKSFYYRHYYLHFMMTLHSFADNILDFFLGPFGLPRLECL